jgi:cobalt-zinc-cadmium efflux system outer membrane protein
MIAFAARLSVAQSGLNLRSPLDTSGSGTQPGNRPGMSIGRTPPSVYQRNDRQVVSNPEQLLTPRIAADVVPKHGAPLDDRQAGELGDLKTGLRLEDAEEMMLRQNPDIIAARSEVEQARADIITAGLRNNPLFFADMQGIPYRILGPHQVDVNFAYPVDVSGKRRTRVRSANCVYRAIEWKFADFIRGQRDNLQTIFVDTLAAQLMLERLESLPRRRAPRLRSLKKELDEATKRVGDAVSKKRPRAEIDLQENEENNLRKELEIEEEYERIEHQAADDAKSFFRDQRNKLALLLNSPDSASIALRGWLDDTRTYPDPDSEDKREVEDARRKLAGLIENAFNNRPDLQSQRWNCCRALADVEAVKAARWDDVAFLVQPYTYIQGFTNSSAWALGVTVPLPIYNRQQGNLIKARQLVGQALAVLASLENTVKAEVEAAYNNVHDSRDDMLLFQSYMNNRHKRLVDFIPTNQKERSPKQVENYLVKLDPIVRRLANEQINKDKAAYFDALLRHRKALLRLNTVTGCIVCPNSPSEPTSPFGPEPASRVKP